MPKKMPKQLSPTTIAVDFDGTLAEHRYPDIGPEVPQAVATCRALQDAGHRLILLTMRNGGELDEAVSWCQARGLRDWFGVNANPSQESWAWASRKVYAALYIDDAALGCPLIYPSTHSRPYVDWAAVRDLLISRNLLSSS